MGLAGMAVDAPYRAIPKLGRTIPHRQPIKSLLRRLGTPCHGDAAFHHLRNLESRTPPAYGGTLCLCHAAQTISHRSASAKRCERYRVFSYAGNARHTVRASSPMAT